MAEQFYTILTQVGKAKIANATALGTKVNFKEMAVGDGKGNYYNPTENQTELVNEVWRGQINHVEVDNINPNWIKISIVIPSTIGGFTIREAGIFDDKGNMIAIGKYPETYKPILDDGSSKDLLINMILEVSNTSSVTLKVDPTVILATKKDVEILNNKIENIEVPVTKVNDKTGDVVLSAADIKTSSGETIETQLADMTQQIENIDLSADKVKVNNSNLNSKDVNSALTELFTFADNGKKNWVDVIGSPLSTGDSFSTLKSKTQSLKNTMASNLNSKGQSASGTEGLNSLINKIKNIDMNSPFSISFPEVKYITEITYIDRDAKKYYLKQKRISLSNTMEVNFNGTVLKFHEYEYDACTFCPWGFLEASEMNPVLITLYNYPGGTKIAELRGKESTSKGFSNARVIKVNGAYYAFICSSSYKSSYVLLKDANNTILLSGEVNDEYTDRDAEVICDVKTKCFVATINRSCFAVDFDKKKLVDFNISATSLSVVLGLGLNI